MLDGIVTDANGGIWTTSGTGIFLPDDSTVVAAYLPSAADIISGNVSFTLTSTGNGNCPAAADGMDATIISPVSSIAGNDTLICAGVNNFQLNGVVSGTGVSQWTTNGTGVFIPDATAVNAVYQPSAADTVAGNVLLTLSVSNTCFSAADTLNLSFINAPVPNAGVDHVVCIGDSVSVTGSVSGANSFHWLTSGDGSFFPDDTSLTTTYFPGPLDIITGTISLGMTAVGFPQFKYDRKNNHAGTHQVKGDLVKANHYKSPCVTFQPKGTRLDDPQGCQGRPCSPTMRKDSRYSGSPRPSRLSVTSAAVRTTDTGVRSSCEASAMKRRC